MTKKILIADDDPVVSKTLKTALERSGYEVDTAANGEECLQKVLINKPDLLLLDIMMPRMDGFSFLVAIKELRVLTGCAPQMPVMVITGKDNEVNRNLMTHEDIKDYILKPFDLKELLSKIEKIFDLSL